jgi:DnaJ-domain-containing protein 1
MDENVRTALDLFGLSVPFTQAQLDAKRQELMTTWHPHRYANLTNNPRKYMEMYKKGEAKTKEITAAYERLAAWLRTQP